SWNNTTFASTGFVTLIISVNQQAGTISLSFNSTGNVLGQGPLPQTVRNATFNSSTATFAATVGQLGDGTFTINALGEITARGINIPGGGITRWDATGTIGGGNIQLNATITFA